MGNRTKFKEKIERRVIRIERRSKKAVVLAAIITVILIGFIGLGIFDNTNSSPIFTDSTGIEWRILNQDDSGNMLIITERAHGVIGGCCEELPCMRGGIVAYSTINNYKRLNESDVLRYALNEWFKYALATELKEVALPAKNIDNDVRSEPGGLGWEMENSLEGLSAAGAGSATPENSLFILSISEVNQYFGSRKALQGICLRSWWLRSPGGDAERPIAYVRVDTEAFIWHVEATESMWFRPALWIKNFPY